MKEQKTKIVAFRLPDRVEEQLMQKAKPRESKSDLMRRVVDRFLKLK